MKRTEETTLVYSSETGRVGHGASKARGTQPSKPSKPPADGTVRLRREVKGRGGGTVIVITGVPLKGEALKDLAGALKKRCGSGGTVKEGVIEIQGDHRETLLKELESRGYQVKLAGG
ncbi:MAG: stress response translation initiation inhibitor YciH [Oryzomonas sp.]|uniref:stress response translation initiation inhibitor YciH n=1 Tax=Oryzomonas sp. TaxID=2855186 RepID=UPI002847363C|nr:stress response translation initiation inhibitor YciH [Oryzomonas sp.]MDR3580432.1 stress response translation initiation inhibitor YciH [Oryzomonas sp.]